MSCFVRILAPGQWVPAEASYDLVSTQFLHLPKNPRESLFRVLAASAAPGGSLLIVGHHPSDRQTTIPRPPIPELFFTASDVAALLDPHGWTSPSARPVRAAPPTPQAVPSPSTTRCDGRGSADSASARPVPPRRCRRHRPLTRRTGRSPWGLWWLGDHQNQRSRSRLAVRVASPRTRSTSGSMST
jgi:hypothetical protein